MQRDHFRGALLGTFVGDALGMPLEGPGQILFGLRGEVRDLLTARLGRGTYTDDTQLMIGLAEALSETPGRLCRDRVAARFGELFDTRRGYGGNVIKILSSIHRGTPWRDAVERHLLPGGSYANGAAMRVAPVALAFYGDEAAVARAAREQSEVTGHSHPVGAFGAEVLALAVHRALRRGTEKKPFDVAPLAAELRPRAVDEFRYAFDRNSQDFGCLEWQGGGFDRQGNGIYCEAAGDQYTNGKSQHAREQSSTPGLVLPIHYFPR